MIDYPLALSSWGDEEINAIQGVIKKGMYSMGAEVRQFESDFSDFFGSKYAVMVNSGSSANLLAVAALFFLKENALKPGDEVIVPAVSWSTTYSPLQQYGLKVVFVDIDINTLNMNLDQLENAITDETRAIFAVNLLGNPNNFERISSLIAGKNILLLEDNCESMGAKFQGKYAGKFGVMGTFSTFFSHHISTMEGGVVVTDDEELYHIMLSIRAHGWTRNLPKNNLVSGVKSDNPFEESFKFVLPGYNLRPLEMSGAIGQRQLEKLPGFVDSRRENAAYFQERMKDNEHLIIQAETGESSWFGFSLIVKEESPLRRQDVMYLLNDKGVETRPIVTGNFVANPVIEYYDYVVPFDLMSSEYLDANGFFIGNHHTDCRSGLKQICDTLSRL